MGSRGMGKLRSLSLPPSTKLGTTLGLPQWRTTPLFNCNPNPHSSSLCILTQTTSANVSVGANRVAATGITTKVGEGTNEKPVQDVMGFDETYLKMVGLQRERMPKHVGVILDGNRRWCEKYNNGKLTYEGFYKGYILLGDLCVKLGIPAASWFIFSSCTWKRSDEANNLMFCQLKESLEENLEKFTREGIKISIIGEKWRLPNWLLDAAEKVEEATKNGKTLHMMYGIPYGGRTDIVEAARRVTRRVMAGEIEPEDVDEDMVESELTTGICQVPNPELVIRNGAKRRISNFFLWQASYSELYFDDSLTFEFGEAEFLDSLRCYQNREKRFGK